MENEDLKLELKKRPVNLSKIMSQLTKSEGGLYPHEILMLSMVSRYQVNTYNNDFDWFWKDRYGIEDPQALINKLLNQGFVGIEDTKARMFRLTIPKIKELLEEYGCKLTGKKAELIDRLFVEGDVGAIESKLPPPRYCLTDLGKEEIEREENEYIISRKISPISIYEMNILLYKNNPLNLSYKDFIWRRYLEESEEALKKLNFGIYLNTRLEMYYFLKNENRDKERLYYLCEVVAYDLSGLGNSYNPEYNETAYHIESDIEHLFHFMDRPFISIAPAVIEYIKELRDKIKSEGLNFEEEVIKNLKEIKVYRSIFTPEERIEILFAELDENFERLEEIYLIAETRYKEYGKKLENGDKNTIIEFFSKLNNVDKNTIEEYFNKLYDTAEEILNASKSSSKQKESKWKLETDRDTFYEFDKNVIENEINKLDTLECDWLVLEPPENINGTIYIQVCIETAEEDYRRESEDFHIELCFEDEDGNLTSFMKDNLTKEEVIKIFIDYFENNNIPDIKDWYSVEL